MAIMNCFAKVSCTLSGHDAKINSMTNFCYAINLYAEQLLLFTDGEIFSKPSGMMPKPNISDLSGSESDSGYLSSLHMSEKTNGHRVHKG